jgi:hypothetical protein
MIPTLLALTQVVTAGGWTLAGLEADTNAKLKTLEASINPEKQILTIKNIQFGMGEGYSALIIYEITDKK